MIRFVRGSYDPDYNFDNPTTREDMEERLTTWYHNEMWKMIDNDDLVESLVDTFEDKITNMDYEELESIYLDHIGL